MRKREERERERERERKRERERESNFADVEPVLMFILFHCLRLAMLQSSLLLHGLVHSGVRMVSPMLPAQRRALGTLWL